MPSELKPHEVCRRTFLRNGLSGVGLLAYPIAWIVMPEEPLMLSAPVGQQAPSV